MEFLIQFIYIYITSTYFISLLKKMRLLTSYSNNRINNLVKLLIIYISNRFFIAKNNILSLKSKLSKESAIDFALLT
jgi:hypothetical protein